MAIAAFLIYQENVA